ncbi:glycoside hydrolase family 16 protein [Mycobacterium sp. 236(2023)]|uniref:glycoside hydrolase family 16 protein n=1 Tax=Mycobacterium sp. 236(2023) TaxID=3038163 RepID=UPI00241587DD|nr:glycoside hydrolase family 16 protein [Mycobacterium sp. 236(2023)]MDG4668988.1 glycoside hydrolase family 16 protein [Mycobacterium sp. 236(2023)]
MAAGLGAAVMTGTATASASTDDSGASGASTSASSDAPATKASRNAEKDATKDEAAESASDTDDTETDTADDTEADDKDTDGVSVEEDTVADEAAEDPDDDTADLYGRHAAKPSNTTPSNTETATPKSEQEPAADIATAPVALRAAATAPATDPVLVAAATSTKVTLGSMIVDMLYSWGIRSSKMGTNWLDIKVSKSTETRWLTRRAEIYRNVVIPEPENPTEPEEPNEPEQPSGPKLLWETNFSSMAEAMKYWGFQTGRWGQSAGENQYYTDGDNVYIDADGNLVIDARREATPDNLGSPNNYTSARIVTMGKQSFGVGQRIVARIQMPVTKGVLPAFWSVGLEPGHEFDWPRQGEIDIVEIPTLGTPASAGAWSGNIHGPSAANNTVDVKLHNIGADLGVDVSQGFHEYGIDWHADRIVWHVDGVEMGQITKAQYEALGGNWTPFSGAWDHYLILNVAVGNPWNGDPDPSKPFSAQMKVDWVKAYDL